MRVKLQVSISQAEVRGEWWCWNDPAEGVSEIVGFCRSTSYYQPINQSVF